MTDRFVSEADIEAAKKKRQEEWEKVRKPDDALEAPEEEVDNRSLYDRLKEVRDKKQADYDEEHRFKNMIRGLDSDETDFLSRVDDIKAQQDRIKKEEEKAILSEFGQARCKRIEEEGPSVSQLRPQPTTTPSAPKQSKQAAIIRTAIKRRSSSEKSGPAVEEKRAVPAKSEDNNREEVTNPTAMKVIGVLPGMAYYASSTDSDSSSDSDTDGSSQMAVLPVLVQNVNEKGEKNKQSGDSASEE